MSPARTLRLLHLAGEGTRRDRMMQASALVEGLAAKGHRAVLARLPARRLARVRALRGLLKSGDWDLVHMHDTAALSDLGLSAIGLPHVPRLLTIGGDIRYGDRVLPARVASKVDHFFAVSEWVWSALVRTGIPQERISVVHAGIDLKRFTLEAPEAMRRREAARAQFGVEPDDFLVGSVLHLRRESGADLLVEATRMILSGEVPPGDARLKLLVVGEGPHRPALEQVAREAGIGSALLLAEEREDIADLLCAMDVYAYPAVSGDGFPVSLLEAMAMGLPVVATDLMGIREIIDNGRHGLIAPVADPKGLALNILRLRRDEAFAREIGHFGSLKVQRYGLKSMVDRAEEIYFRLAREKS